MYCAQCGAWNPDDSEYCAKCGRRIEREQPATPKGIAPCAVMGLLVIGSMVVLVALGGILFRDRIYRAWLAFNGGPSPVIATPEPTVPPSPMPATATVEPSPTIEPTAAPPPTAVPTQPPAPPPTAAVRSFKLVYLQCIPHGFSLGSVKGQVFAKNGQIIPGAKVRIRINDYDWQSDANPATTNSAGWYEWTLEVEQKITFVELIIDGKPVPFAPKDFEVVSKAGCFQRVDFVEQ